MISLQIDALLITDRNELRENICGTLILGSHSRYSNKKKNIYITNIIEH
jgi:hypothetical protein